MSTDTPVPTLEVTPTSEPMAEERAVEIYVNFLDDKIPFYWADGSVAYFSDLCWERQGARAEALQGLTVRDVTGDGIPELCSAPHSLKGGGGEIWTIREGRVEYLDGLNPSYERILPNGGIFYYRPGAAPLHNDYGYRWLSPESRELPELGFSTYDSDQDGEMDRYYIGGLEIPIFTEDEEVTREEWEETTAPYFALWEAEPTEEQRSQSFLNWVEGNFSIKLPFPFGQWNPSTSVTNIDFPAYENYLSPEDWETFQAFLPLLKEEATYWGGHVVTEKDNYEGTDRTLGTLFNDFLASRNIPPRPFELNSFTLCDFDGDGEKELVLWASEFGGWYFILHREGDRFYGTHMPVRWLQDLQTNGVSYGSGGAFTGIWHRLCFEDGAFWQETLAVRDYDFDPRQSHYFIDGEEVSESDFLIWENDLPGSALWYRPIYLEAAS